MRSLIFKAILLFTGLHFCLCAQAQASDVQLNKYVFKDGSTIRGMSDNGLWAVAYGPSTTNGSLYNYPKLINVKTKEVISLLDENSTETVHSCFGDDVSDDGKTIVGELNGKPAFWKSGTGWKTLPLPVGWTEGLVDGITPDGKYGVGRANDYTNGFCEYPVMWNLETGAIVSTPNFPTNGIQGTNENMVRFESITPDARYIMGCVSYSYVSNVMYFIYDRNDNSWLPVGFSYNATTKRCTPLAEGIAHLENAYFSPDGKWVGGTAYMVKEIAGSQFGNEYRAPFRYNIETKVFEIHDDTESQNLCCAIIDNSGTLYAATPPNSPVRTLYVRNGKYWYPLTEILSQCYGINYYETSGFEYSGTPIAVSGDGKTLGAIATAIEDNYTLTLPEAFGTAAAKVNLLNTYTITPTSGSEFTTLKSLTVKFNRDIEVLSEKNAVLLTDEAGNTIRSSISFGVSSSNDKTVDIGFRTTTLEAGKKYYINIPAGSISIKGDGTCTNEAIKIEYKGRAATPVKVISTAPASGSSVALLNYSTNPILLKFDTNIKLTDNAEAALYLNDEPAAISDLEMEYYNNMVLVFPATAQYLYKNNNYKVVIKAGSISDVTDGNSNEQIEINYEGSYERFVVSNDTLIYSEDFTYGVANMLLYEGDKLTPNDEMKSWDFLATERPWVPVRDNDATDYCAASHSMYTPAGKSNDWMMTPQCYIPDSKCVLEFDAQSYLSTKNDKLKIIVYASEREMNMLTDEDIATIESQGTVVFNESLKAGGGLLAGNWKHYSIALSSYVDKSIYVAFINENEDQSAIFVDNVKIVHNNDFITALKVPETVIAKNSQVIEGRVTANNLNETYNGLELTLLDANNNAVDVITDANVSMKYNDTYDFVFAKELPLTIGIENKYAIRVKLGNSVDTLKTTIKNLSFKPTKRIVLEIKTGQDCVFCPQGKVTLDKLEGIYGEQIIPIEYHTYVGDPLESGMTAYSDEFLGLSAAPSAKINRSAEAYSPMANVITNGVSDYAFSIGNGKTWIDVIEKEMTTDAEANIDIAASFNEATGNITMDCHYMFAINKEKQNISILPIVVEDNVSGYQYNNFYKTVDADLGPWQQGGEYGEEAVLYTHNDVARGIMSNSYFGQTGIVPASITSGEVYKTSMEFARPNADNIYNCKVVCMMIDANTGKVINVARTNILSSSGISGVNHDDLNLSLADGTLNISSAKAAKVELFTADGRMIAHQTINGNGSVSMNSHKGLVIAKISIDGKTIVKKITIK